MTLKRSHAMEFHPLGCTSNGDERLLIENLAVFVTIVLKYK